MSLMLVQVLVHESLFPELYKTVNPLALNVINSNLLEFQMKTEYPNKIKNITPNSTSP